jgi:hypothetical protein
MDAARFARHLIEDGIGLSSPTSLIVWVRVILGNILKDFLR